MNIKNFSGKNITVNPLTENTVNRNGIIIGPTGSGMSFYMNYLANSEASKEIKILDQGQSYKEFVKQFGAEYIENQDK